MTQGYYAEDKSAYEKFWTGVKEQQDVESAKEWGYSLSSGMVPKTAYNEAYWEAYRTILDQYGITDAEYEELQAWSDLDDIGILAVDGETMAKLVERAGAENLYDLEAEYPPVLIAPKCEMSTHSIIYGEGRKADYLYCEVENASALQSGDMQELTLAGLNAEGEYAGVEFPVTVAGFVTDEMLSDVIELHMERMWFIVGPEVAEKIELATFGDSEDTFFRWYGLIKIRRPDGEFGNYLLEQSRKDEPGELSVYRNEGVAMGDMKGAMNSAIRILLTCFVILTSVICMLNLYNSVRGRISGKRKEFAILRSVGMTERQMYKMLCMEAGGILLRSVTIAVLVSTPLILFVDRMIVQLWGNVGVSFPWAVYGLAIALAAAAVFGMTLFSYRMEKKENILVDIRSESV